MRKGFTLIELIIVVAIIGILAAVVVPAYKRYVECKNTGKCESPPTSNRQWLGDGFYKVTLEDGTRCVGRSGEGLTCEFNKPNLEVER